MNLQIRNVTAYEFTETIWPCKFICNMKEVLQINLQNQTISFQFKKIIKLVSVFAAGIDDLVFKIF